MFFLKMVKNELFHPFYMMAGLIYIVVRLSMVYGKYKIFFVIGELVHIIDSAILCWKFSRKFTNKVNYSALNGMETNTVTSNDVESNKKQQE